MRVRGLGAVARVRSDEAFDVDDLAEDDLAEDDLVEDDLVEDDRVLDDLVDDECEAVDSVDRRGGDDSDADGVGRAMVMT